MVELALTFLIEIWDVLGHFTTIGDGGRDGASSTERLGQEQDWSGLRSRARAAGQRQHGLYFLHNAMRIVTVMLAIELPALAGRASCRRHR